MMTRQGTHRAGFGRRRSAKANLQPNIIYIYSQLTMTLVARSSALRRQVIQSRAFVPSRNVHDYKVCSPMPW